MKTNKKHEYEEMIVLLKKQHGYDHANNSKYGKEHTKDLIIAHILRVDNHKFYLWYDSVTALFIILLISLLVYWYKGDISTIVILAPLAFASVIAIMVFAYLSGKKEKQLEEETKQFF